LECFSAGLSGPILALGALLAALGVALGAFGGMRCGIARRSAARLVNTAVQWHMWHAVALVALAPAPIDGRGLPALLIGAGPPIFAGSLYVMALSGLRWLGAIPRRWPFADCRLALPPGGPFGFRHRRATHPFAASAS
jgi:uncharacterized membrane protein YgdD (TMEM256/DUF423 family)